MAKSGQMMKMKVEWYLMFSFLVYSLFRTPSINADHCVLMSDQGYLENSSFWIFQVQIGVSTFLFHKIVGRFEIELTQMVTDQHFVLAQVKRHLHSPKK